jgi:hypothetical protein
MHWFFLAKQHIFMIYLAISIDHALWLVRGQFRGIPRDPIAVVLLVFWTVMNLHGIIAGALFHQGASAIVDDTVPMLLGLLTVLRCSLDKNVDFTRAYSRIRAWVCWSVAISIPVGIFTGHSAPNGHLLAFFIIVFAVELATNKSTQEVLLYTVALLLTFTFSLDDLNRTTLAATPVLILAGLVYRIRFSILSGLLGFLVLAAAPFLLWMAVPEDSKTYERIQAIISPETVNQNTRSGSINSRRLEVEQIQAELERHGKTAVYFGMGHGATYEYNAFGGYVPNQGHAHFATSYMNLRYGLIGKFYVWLIGSTLLAGAIIALLNKTRMALFIGSLSIVCFIYLFTYVNFLFYLSALPFIILLPELRAFQGRPKVVPISSAITSNSCNLYCETAKRVRKHEPN